MRAYCLIREKPWYRRDAFVAGLKAAGHEVVCEHPRRIDRDTLLVIWNRYNEGHLLAQKVEALGGRVLVAENGYLAVGGGTPKFEVYSPAGGQQDHRYALAEGWHNGGGRWPAGGPARWLQLGIELAPWRTDGDHILVCPNRSFGAPGRIMHPDWPERLAAKLRKATRRPVRIRPHPGNNAPKRSLEDDLKGAWAVYVWNSSAGVHAAVRGIPVFSDAPNWILKGAASDGPVDAPTLPDRLPNFERLAWAQWSVAEIASGEPFKALLQ